MNAVMKSSVSAKAVKVSRTQVRPQASLKQFAQASRDMVKDLRIS